MKAKIEKQLVKVANTFYQRKAKLEQVKKGYTRVCNGMLYWYWQDYTFYHVGSHGGLQTFSANGYTRSINNKGVKELVSLCKQSLELGKYSEELYNKMIQTIEAFNIRCGLEYEIF